jgi:hypothetical protein
MPYVPLGRAVKVSDTVAGASVEGHPVEPEPYYLIADANFSAPQILSDERYAGA